MNWTPIAILLSAAITLGSFIYGYGKLTQKVQGIIDAQKEISISLKSSCDSVDKFKDQCHNDMQEQRQDISDIKERISVLESQSQGG